MLNLITGVPGSGKTLFTLYSLKDIKDRPIYYHNIEDLDPQLGWIPLKDPFNFHKEVPDGAIIIIDEVQQVFRQRPPKNPVPDALQFIETHRHHGIDIYFITQLPKFLDHHARGLAGQHIHFHRNFSMPFATQYTFQRYTDIEDRRALHTGQKTRFTYPKKIFGLYKSAEFHTHKRTIPKKAFFFLALIPVVIFSLYSTFDYFANFDVASESNALTQSAISNNSLPVKSSSEFWTTALTPQVPGLPFTAPLYKAENSVNDIPMIKGCLEWSSGDGCACYTQQGTRIQMELAQCRHFIRNPYFDFTKEPKKEEEKVRIVYVDKQEYLSLQRNSQELPNLNRSPDIIN